jgi:FtsH-binding integral membrane protein
MSTPLTVSAPALDRQQMFLRGVGIWTAGGVLLTTFIAYILMNNASLMAHFYEVKNGHAGLSLLGWVAFFGPLAVIAFVSFMKPDLSKNGMIAMYLFVASCFGVTFAPLAIVYTGDSIVAALLATAVSFGGFATYGFLTKRSLAGVGHYAFMALWGLIAVSLISLFWPSVHLNFFIGAAGVVIFTLLTAYDVQRIRDMSLEVSDDRMVIWGALRLYLDIVNLCLSFIRLMGVRR